MSLSNVGNKADLNHDGMVNLEDWGEFCHKWMFEQVLLAEDLDRNGRVDILDWCEFVKHWLWRK